MVTNIYTSMLCPSTHEHEFMLKHNRVVSCKLIAYFPLSVTSMTAGDVIVTINGASVEGSSHQQILGLIKDSANSLK